jgi:hypothetical protein
MPLKKIGIWNQTELSNIEVDENSPKMPADEYVTKKIEPSNTRINLEKYGHSC